MPTSVTLDPGEPLEATSAVLAMIAWPEELSNGEKITFAQAALVAHLMRLAATADDAWTWRRQCLKPGYLLLEPAKVRQSCKLTFDRLTAALKVARAARPFIGEVLAGTALPLPPGVSRLSLNVVIPFALGDDSEIDTHNFEHRVFRRWLPVLHLAVALEQALMAAEAVTGRAVSPEALMLTPEFLPWFVDRAQQLEPAVLAIREFEVDPERLVRVRLAGQVQHSGVGSTQRPAVEPDGVRLAWDDTAYECGSIHSVPAQRSGRQARSCPCGTCSAIEAPDACRRPFPGRGLGTCAQRARERDAMSSLAPSDLLPAADVARLFSRTLRTPRTLSNWERAGLLVPIRIRWQRYFRLRDVEALLCGPAAAFGAQTVFSQEDSDPE